MIDRYCRKNAVRPATESARQTPPTDDCEIMPDGFHRVERDLAGLWIRNLETGLLEKSNLRGAGFISCFALLPDGIHCVTGSWGNTHIWNLVTNECEKVLTGHIGQINCLAITADGTRCITGSSDKTARVWNLSTCECLRVLAGHTGGVSCLALTIDGIHCVTGSRDHTARVWNLASGECEQILEGCMSAIERLEIVTDGIDCYIYSDDKWGQVWVHFGLPAQLQEVLSSLSIAQVVLLGDIANLQKSCHQGYVRRVVIKKHNKDGTSSNSYHAYRTLPRGIKELVSPYVCNDNQNAVMKFAKNSMRSIGNMVDNHPYLATAAVIELLAALYA